MYVKLFDTVMFYYVILVNLQKCHFFKISNFPPVPAPHVPTSQGPEHGSRMPASAGDAAGDTSR
ncbi:unnamed protein product, partial [Staurois parvus]